MKSFPIHPSHTPEVSGLISSIDTVLESPSPNRFSVASRYADGIVVNGLPYSLQQSVQTTGDNPTVVIPDDITDLEDPEWFVRHTNDGCFGQTSLIVRTDLNSWFLPRRIPAPTGSSNSRLYDMESTMLVESDDPKYPEKWDRTINFVLKQLEEHGNTDLGEFWLAVGEENSDAEPEVSRARDDYKLVEIGRYNLITGSNDAMLGSGVVWELLFNRSEQNKEQELYKLRMTPDALQMVACRGLLRWNREPRAINPYKFDPTLIGRLANLTQQIA